MSRLDLIGPIVAAALVLVGFGLPWVHGNGPFSLQTFSGLELARVIRNAAFAVEWPSPVRSAAVVLYLVPAGAVNAAVLSAAAGMLGLPSRPRAWSSILPGAFTCAVLAAVLALAAVPLGPVHEFLGHPEPGAAVEAVGGMTLIWLGMRQPRSRV